MCMNIHSLTHSVTRLIDYQVPVRVDNLQDPYPRLYELFKHSLGDWTFDVLVS